MQFYADGEKKQTLIEHILDVQHKTSRFASDFECETWGSLLGSWHDLGKFMEAFQAYMLEGSSAVEHAIVGGRYAIDAFPTAPLQRLALLFCITCHHTGLQSSSHIQGRLSKATKMLHAATKNTPAELLNRKLPDWPDWLVPPENNTEPEQINEWKRSLEFWMRMLHSCLVDADWLSAEKRDPDTPIRPKFPSLSILRDKLDEHINEKIAKAKNEDWTLVNQQREIVFNACRSASENSSGFFSLTVPTGGGKTLSGMSFALNHAVNNNLSRVIIVLPYTSIIKQNSSVYANIFGQDNVIEHHSSLTPEKDTERNRLAAENWDAPLIVTTNVQFFESLFACRNSKLRKLHNIAKSVVIFDEAQSFPPRLLYPILDGLKELKAHYGCSIILSTATQPALGKRDEFSCGLEDIIEIIPDTVTLSRNLARVKVEWDIDDITEYCDIAERVRSEKMKKVLLVTHKRADARELAGMLLGGAYHLSASMCPAHRDRVLRIVKKALPHKGRTVRLVSTQLIEAGVDVDFPIVFRALAGIDSISQTAGRCNREGKSDFGRLIVFRTSTEPPPGILRLGKGITESLLNLEDENVVPRNSDGSLDLSTPKTFQTYFRLFYSSVQKDGAGVQTGRATLDYPEVAKRFKMIDSKTYSVVVPYRDAYEKLAYVRDKFKPSREDFRSLQPYIVQIYQDEFDRLNIAGTLESLHEKAFYYLAPQYERLYDLKFGLITTEENLYPDCEILIVDN